MIRFSTFPRTQVPPPFVEAVVGVFRAHEGAVGTVERDKVLTSDEALAVPRADLMAIGFEVEGGKRADEKIRRQVFFGENAQSAAGGPPRPWETSISKTC